MKQTNFPDRDVAYVRHRGHPPGIADAFGTLNQWIADQKIDPKNETIMGVYWDGPDKRPVESIRNDACITVPAPEACTGPTQHQVIPGGLCAVYSCTIPIDGFGKAWSDAFAELAKDNSIKFDCSRPCFEIYYNHACDHPERKWILDICIPIASA